MAILTDTHKRELLEDAGNSRLRDEFRQLQHGRSQVAPEDYLAFLTSAARMVRNPRPWRRIEGDRFLI